MLTNRHQAAVVQTLDSAIHWINHYPLDNSIGFASIYLLDSDLSGGQRYASFEQLAPVVQRVHWINHHAIDNSIKFESTYQVIMNSDFQWIAQSTISYVSKLKIQNIGNVLTRYKEIFVFRTKLRVVLFAVLVK